ncbi:pilus assembly protein TadG-related protein [Streptomyces boninensis]|uniref:pilus assembly protein TadG-related protein n=1 Tax=Streptomyces boninensis TaxID=2039455 RepID=UPI003B210075
MIGSRPPRTGCRGDDQGQVTVFVLGAVLIGWMFAGIVIDGGLALAGKVRALNNAQEAARTGAQQLDLRLLRDEQRVRLDASKAVGAARAYVAGTGDAADVAVRGNRVHVTVTHHQRAQLLQLVGVRQLVTTATATAEAQRGPHQTNEGQ